MTFILPLWSMQLGNPLKLLSDCTIGLAQWLSQLPAHQIITARPPLWFIGLFYLLLFLAGYRVLRGRLMGRAVTLGIGVWLILFFWLVPFRDQEFGRSTFHVLDVGHGCAVVGELSDGRVLCYDAGSMSRMDIGSAVILPFLRARGIGRLDAVFISHTNFDHYCAVPDLCDTLKVASVYTNEYVSAKEKKSASALLFRDIEASGLSVETLSQDDRLESIEVLWPPKNDGTLSLSTNDQSLVLRITQPGGTLLLAGDIGERPQQWLVQNRGDSLKSDVLLLPHHGSVSKNLEAFVAAVDPKWIVNSSGYLNERKVDRLQEVSGNKPILHTFSGGAIRIDITEQGVDHLQAFGLRLPPKLNQNN
jgi:competence protein ComEC